MATAPEKRHGASEAAQPAKTTTPTATAEAATSPAAAQATRAARHGVLLEKAKALNRTGAAPPDAVLETAYELHREIGRRGLELRRGNGRDDAMLRALAVALQVSDAKFSAALKRSGTTAEDYLRAFLGVSAPFARMFIEIWDFLGRHFAPAAGETITVRFGKNAQSTVVDLEQFRVYAESARLVALSSTYFVWRRDELHMLFGLRQECFSNVKWRPLSPRYEPSQPYALPPFAARTEQDEIGKRIHSALQAAIDFAASTDISLARVGYTDPVPTDGADGSNEMEERKAIGRLLHDLVPGWFPVLSEWRHIPDAAKQKAQEYFEQVIKPKLPTHKYNAAQLVREALDLLELPFWRHRWHTYEIWASVATLQALEPNGIRPLVKDGRLAIDASAPAVIAEIGTPPRGYASVQSETRIATPSRKVRPDLRISSDNPPTNSGTAVIVEFKQRKQLTEKHVRDVLTWYREACGPEGGVVMVNYDDASELEYTTWPDRCALIRNVHPGNANAVQRFSDAVLGLARRAGIAPDRRYVLFDLSASMQPALESTDKARLAAVLSDPDVEVYGFHAGLASDKPLNSLGDLLHFGGSTDLARAVAELKKLFDSQGRRFPDRITVITDGEYDTPPTETYGAELVELRLSEV